MAVHVDERPIYLVAIAPRAGEAEYAGDVDADHDAVLGARLNAWCEALPAPPSVVFASTAPGAYAVAEGFVDGAAVVHRSDLDPFFNDPSLPARTSAAGSRAAVESSLWFARPRFGRSRVLADTSLAFSAAGRTRGRRRTATLPRASKTCSSTSRRPSLPR